MRITHLAMSRWHQNFNDLHISCQIIFLANFKILFQFLLSASIFNDRVYFRSLKQQKMIKKTNMCHIIIHLLSYLSKGNLTFFLCFVFEGFYFLLYLLSVICELKCRNVPDCSCTHLVSSNKRLTLYSKWSCENKTHMWGNIHKQIF